MKKVKTKSVYTSGDVARITGTAPRTVSKWIDQGLLKGYRIPGGDARRVTHENLVRFLLSQNMPLNGLQADAVRVLLIGVDALTSDTIHAGLGDLARIFDSYNLFAAGQIAVEQSPQIVVVDAAIGRGDAVRVAARLRMDDGTAESRLAVLLPEDSLAVSEDWERLFAAVFTRPFDSLKLVEWIRDGLFAEGVEGC